MRLQPRNAKSLTLRPFKRERPGHACGLERRQRVERLLRVVKDPVPRIRLRGAEGLHHLLHGSNRGAFRREVTHEHLAPALLVHDWTLRQSRARLDDDIRLARNAHRRADGEFPARIPKAYDTLVQRLARLARTALPATCGERQNAVAGLDPPLELRHPFRRNPQPSAARMSVDDSGQDRKPLRAVVKLENALLLFLEHELPRIHCRPVGNPQGDRSVRFGPQVDL